jgi:nucleotide-binding universal stress UspA family protein
MSERDVLTRGPTSGSGYVREVQTVLVPLDGSEGPVWVLKPLRRLLLGGGAPRGAHVGARFGVEVVLLHVTPPAGTEAAELELAASRAALDALRLELAADGIAASVRQAQGDAVEHILAAAEATNADLVAMSTHGRTGVARLVRGSVAEGVLRRSRRPVLLVNPHVEGRGLEAGVRTLLVPLDGTPEALEVLPLAAALARGDEAEVVLAHAEPEPSGLAHEAVFGPAVARLRAAGATRVRERVLVGPPAAAIVEAAAYERADLVALATHGRVGLERLWLGSVAEEVARACSVPVVVRRVSAATPS